MRVVGNGDHNEKVWVGFDGHTYTHEEFARNSNNIVRVVHYGVV